LTIGFGIKGVIDNGRCSLSQKTIDGVSICFLCRKRRGGGEGCEGRRLGMERQGVGVRGGRRISRMGGLRVERE
jgi:hypothetical protein